MAQPIKCVRVLKHPTLATSLIPLTPTAAYRSPTSRGMEQQEEETVARVAASVLKPSSPKKETKGGKDEWRIRTISVAKNLPALNGDGLSLVVYPPLTPDGRARLLAVRAHISGDGIHYSKFALLDCPLYGIHQTAWPTPHNADFIMETAYLSSNFEEMGNLYLYGKRLVADMGITAVKTRMDSLLWQNDQTGTLFRMVNQLAEDAESRAPNTPNDAAAWASKLVRCSKRLPERHTDDAETSSDNAQIEETDESKPSTDWKKRESDSLPHIKREKTALI